MEHDGKHYLVVTDALIKWPKVDQLTSTTAEKPASAFSLIFTQNGLPEVLVTDSRPPFTSKAFNNFLQANDICYILTPPIPPSVKQSGREFYAYLQNDVSLFCEEW